LEGRGASKKEKGDGVVASSRDTEPKKAKKEKKEKPEKSEKVESSKSSIEAGSRDLGEKTKEDEEKEEAKDKPRRDPEGIPGRSDNNSKSKRKKK
jgi:hypothetical protein